MKFNTQKGRAGRDMLPVLVCAALIFMIIVLLPQSTDTTMVNVCVADVQEDPEWLTHKLEKLHDKAMAFTPPAGMDIDDPTLQEIREACFDSLLTAAAEAARQK